MTATWSTAPVGADRELEHDRRRAPRRLLALGVGRLDEVHEARGPRELVRARPQACLGARLRASAGRRACASADQTARARGRRRGRRRSRVTGTEVEADLERRRRRPCRNGPPARTSSRGPRRAAASSRPYPSPWSRRTETTRPLLVDRDLDPDLARRRPPRAPRRCTRGSAATAASASPADRAQSSGRAAAARGEHLRAAAVAGAGPAPPPLGTASPGPSPGEREPEVGQGVDGRRGLRVRRGRGGLRRRRGGLGARRVRRGLRGLGRSGEDRRACGAFGFFVSAIEMAMTSWASPARDRGEAQPEGHVGPQADCDELRPAALHASITSIDRR